MSFNEDVSKSCSLSVYYIGMSVVVSLLIVMFVAGVFAGVCVSKRRLKTAADTGQLPLFEVEVSHAHQCRAVEG